MNVARAKHTLEIATNIAVLVAALAIIVFFARACVSKSGGRTAGKLVSGVVLADIKNLNYSDTPRTLILALSTSCKYCGENVPFYRSLAAKQAALAGQTRIVAVFPEDENDVKTFLQNSQLSLDFRSSIDLATLHVSATPTLILTDSSKRVMESWIGSLSKQSQDDVIKTLSNGISARGAEPTDSFNASKDIQTISLFDENSPLLTITPDNSTQDDLSRVINFFDVDQQGNIFLATDPGIVKFNNRGEFIARTRSPEGFRGVFCVDPDGNTYLPSKLGLIRYDAALRAQREIPLRAVLGSGNIVLKMEADGSQNALYLQTYEPKSYDQVLYKIDLSTLKIYPIFRLEKPVRFSPTFSVGAFDFAIGEDSVYVSDIFEYKVLLYSRTTGKFVRSFSRPNVAAPISEDDGKLTNRKMRIGGLANSPNGLHNYPPILHLNVANNGMLVIWTSRRNSEHKQVIEVYDDNFNLVGVDLKYAHPTINNHVFRNGNVYIPDFGFGRDVSAPNLSPLEVPSLPTSLKVFHFDLSTNTKPI